MNKIANNHRLIFIDYLRVIAFVSVLMCHNYYDSIRAIATDSSFHFLIRSVAYKTLVALDSLGGAGVVIFFIVSGYIIFDVLGKEDVYTFCVKRALRIYPLYFAAVILEQWIDRQSAALPFPQIVPRLLLLGDFFATPYGLNGVEWTLRIELLFYAFMALTKFVGLYQKKWAFLGAIAASITVMLWPCSYAMTRTIGHTFFFMPFVFTGIIINLCERHAISLWFALTFIAAVLFRFLYLFPIYHKDTPLHQSPILGFALFGVIFLLQRKLPYSAMVCFLSELSYAVYLFHHFLIVHIETIIKEYVYHYKLPSLVLFLLFCVAVKFLIEIPVSRLRKSLLPLFSDNLPSPTEKMVSESL